MMEFYVSDRLGFDVAVLNTQQNVAVNFFSGANGVGWGHFRAIVLGSRVARPLRHGFRASAIRAGFKLLDEWPAGADH